ncbi:MAG TPA: sensor histidine kinase [Terriglobales bacterium]|jgi:signal transduction histidine kinase|nr:sensor histidine kinase [Terriglobales bacterium]
MFSHFESHVSNELSSVPVQAKAGSTAEELGLSGRLIALAEEERKHLARELHDDIGQRLSLLAVELDLLTVEQDCAGSVRDKLNQALAEIKELATDVHNLSHRLHSSKLQHLGLPIALKEVCRQMAGQHRIAIDLQADNITPILPEDVSLCLYRVAQEALSNAVKHSQSKRVEVRLKASNGRVLLQIKDFGIGFDPAMQIGGLGLATMQERLRMIGGTLSIQSIPGIGTELIAEARTEFVRDAISAA